MCVKKFIFSRFAGLQNYSRQFYYQINSFTDIFRQLFKPPMLPNVLNTCVAHKIVEWRFMLGFVPAKNPINVKYVIFVVLRKAIWNANSINMLVKEPVTVGIAGIAIIFVQEDISWSFMKDYIGIEFYSSAYCEILFLESVILSSIWEDTPRHSL